MFASRFIRASSSSGSSSRGMNLHAYVSLGMFSSLTLEKALSILPPTLFVFFSGTVS